MAFVTNPINFPNLTSKSSPVGADLLLIADSAASNALKQCTITQALAVASASALTLLATVSPSNAATADFSNKLTASYDNYILIWENLVPITTATVFQLRVGTGGTPTYQSSSYNSYAITNAQAAGTFDHVNGASSEISLHSNAGVGTTMDNTSTNAALSNILITNSNNASNYKSIQGTTCFTAKPSALAFATAFSYGQWQSATVITSLRNLMSSGNISSGTGKLYGYSN